MPETVRNELVAIFHETGPAHHRAFIRTDGADPEWPLWYAEHVQEHVNGLLKAKLTRSKIVQMLVTASEQQAVHAPEADWADFCADFFLKHAPKDAARP
jgi:hypothetical protein